MIDLNRFGTSLDLLWRNSLEFDDFFRAIVSRTVTQDRDERFFNQAGDILSRPHQARRKIDRVPNNGVFSADIIPDRTAKDSSRSHADRTVYAQIDQFLADH